MKKKEGFGFCFSHAKRVHATTRGIVMCKRVKALRIFLTGIFFFLFSRGRVSAEAVRNMGADKR